MREPELSTHNEKIDKLISRVNTGDIRIPAFQRGYVWKQAQIFELLDSVVKNYPIGSILLWHVSAETKLKHTRNIAGYSIPENKPEYPINYVLDGQQRLSSIYATFSNLTVQDNPASQYNPSKDIFEIYYDFKEKQFLSKSEVDSASLHLQTVYLRDFLNKTKILEIFAKLDKIYHADAQILQSKLINYELPVVTIKNRANEEVGVIFERINNTGTKLSTLDLMTAWTWTDDFHLLESIDELSKNLKSKEFGDINKNILLQAISGFIQNDTTTDAILKLSGQLVTDNWIAFCEALKKAIDFLSTEINCVNQEFLPYPQQLVALCKFFSRKKLHSSDQMDAVKKFFWRSSFSNRYSTGKTTLKMNADIEAMDQLNKGNLAAIDSYKTTVDSTELIWTKFSKANPLTRAFLLLMAQSKPLDLTKGTKIDINKALSEYNRKEYHHIFPNSFLKKKGHAHQRIFSLVNFCFLPSDSNKKISSKEPSVYFKNIIPQSKFVEILDSNLIPVRQSIYDLNDFNEFLKVRADLIITAINKIST